MPTWPPLLLTAAAVVTAAAWMILRLLRWWNRRQTRRQLDLAVVAALRDANAHRIAAAQSGLFAIQPPEEG